MILPCPTCGRTITSGTRTPSGLSGPLGESRAMAVNVTCHCCHAIYYVEVRELRATTLSIGELEERRNRTT
jgi:hypothetical protein